VLQEEEKGKKKDAKKKDKKEKKKEEKKGKKSKGKKDVSSITCCFHRLFYNVELVVKFFPLLSSACYISSVWSLWNCHSPRTKLTKDQCLVLGIGRWS